MTLWGVWLIRPSAPVRVSFAPSLGGVFPAILRRLPQQQSENRGTRARRNERRKREPASGSSGRRSSASCAPATCRRSDCPGRTSAPTTPLVSSLEASLDSAAAAKAQSRPHRYVPPAQPDRIPERHPRPAGARSRCRLAAAERRVEPRLRQCDGRRSLADIARAIPVGGAERSAGWRSGVPAVLRAAIPSRFRRTSRKRSTSTSFRSARAAAQWFTTPSRSTPSTRSSFGWRATATSTSRA